MVWFVMEKYHSHLKYMEERGKGNSVLLEEEVEGLNLLISRLEENPTFQAAIPAQIKEPKILLQEVRDLLLHAEIDRVYTDYSEPLISRDMNVSLSDSSPKKLCNTRLIASNRPFKMSSSDTSEGEPSEDEPLPDCAEEKDRSHEDIDIKSDFSDLSPDKMLSSSASSTEITSPDTPRKRRKLKPSIMNSYLKTFELDDDEEEEEEVPDSVTKKKKKKKRKSPSCEVKKKNRRCGKCEQCTSKNCGTCKFCLDMRCFGGPNLKRQSCILRRCVNIGTNKQQIFHVEERSTSCVRCSLSQSDWKLNPMMTCWNCNITLHWACQTEPVSTLSPTDQELTIMWRWRCKPCLQQRQQKYGIPLTLEVPHRNVAVPVTLSVPYTNFATNPVGNIFSKLAATPATRTEKQPETTPTPTSNIFSKFQPKVVIKREILKQAKTVLETKSLISPSKLPLLAGPSISALKSVRLPRLELKDSNKFGNRVPLLSNNVNSASELKPSNSSSEPQNTPEQSDRSDSITPQASTTTDTLGKEGCEESSSSSNLAYGAGAPPPLTLQKIQPVVTLTRLPSVTHPLTIYRHLRPLETLYRNMLCFVPLPKLPPPTVATVTPPLPNKHNTWNPGLCSSRDNVPTLTPKNQSSVLQNSCPNLRAVLDTLKNSITVPKAGLVKSPHILNNCLLPGRYGTITSPRPICSPSLTKSYVPADSDIISSPRPICSPSLTKSYVPADSDIISSPRPICSPSLTKSYVPADSDITSVPDPTLAMSGVLSQTEMLLSSRLSYPILFRFPAPENDLSPYPRLGVVFFSVQNVVPGSVAPLPRSLTSSSLKQNKKRGTKRGAASLKAVTKLVKYQNSARDTEGKKINDENIGGSVRGCEPPLRTYSMRTIRKKRSISFIF
ncbi:uncharacterized protein LOC134812130 isoform X2 [Bolinopsis microptera]|uniref:uncharacterized protein LOC134812130 isoform X2 n=2 Tax=Bolinopsis microptera TaxID=2820187 RepID=UPI00307975C4